MKHCPCCLSEFEDGIQVCQDCSMSLKEGLPPKLNEPEGVRLPESSEFVTAGSASNKFEAARMEEILRAEGIEHILLIARGGASADALSKISQGFWDVLVLEADREQAVALIEEARADFAERDPEFEASLWEEALEGKENGEIGEEGALLPENSVMTEDEADSERGDRKTSVG